MTTGHLLFYSGIALFAFTVILAVIFALKKPKYDPTSTASTGGDGGTQKLRSGYPTDRLTIRREPVIPGTVLLDQSPAASIRPATERLAQETEVLPATEPLTQQTELLPDTEPLPATEPLPQQTEPLPQQTEPLPQQTEVLPDTEPSGTTPLT